MPYLFKFKEVEIIGILEWFPPAPWRSKFVLDDNIPTIYHNSRLIEACEALCEG
jgi:hypothetical protein